MQQILVFFAFISLALPVVAATEKIEIEIEIETETKAEKETSAEAAPEEAGESAESSEAEQDVNFGGPVMSGQEPEIFDEEGADFSLSVFTFGVQQRDSDTNSSKFLEYRDIPQGAVVPFFRLQGKTGDFRYDLIGHDVTQKDQRYHGLLEGSQWKVGIDFTGISHSFGNGGTSILIPEAQNDGTQWRLSDTLQESFQSSVEAAPALNYPVLLGIVQPTLDTQPSSIDIKLQRNRTNLAFSLLPQEGGNFNLDVTYFHERRTGDRTNHGTSFGFSNVIETTEPIRYVTQDFGVKASMKGDWGIAFGGLNVNDFSNTYDAFGWDNPWRGSDSTDSRAYLAPGGSSTNGPKTGLLALPPSNEAWTVNGGTTLLFGRRTRLSANAQLGQWKQNEQSFIPYTTNTTIFTPSGEQASEAPLPVTALDGKIDVFALNGFFTSKITDNVRLNARYRFYENDNKTPRLRFDEGYVRFDAVWEDIPRISVPYGWNSNYFDVYGTFDAGRILGFEVGYKYNKINREFRETEHTTENTIRAAADLRFGAGVLLRALYEFGNRDFDSYHAAEAEHASFLEPGAPANQTVLRRFDQAGRDRTRAGFQLQWTPDSGIVSVGAAYYRNKDNYDDSPVPCADARPQDLVHCTGGEQAPLGLQEAIYETFSLDVDVTPIEGQTFYAFYSREDIFDFQTGRQSGGTLNFDPASNWSSTVDDTVDSLGAGANITLVEDVWFLDIFYRYQKVDGNNMFTTGPNLRGPDNPAQDIAAFDDTKLNFVSAQLKFKFAEQWQIAFGGFFEDYELDDVQTGSVLNYMPGSFFINANNGDYQAWVGWLNLTYSFAL